jgi:hypothetical protein
VVALETVLVDTGLADKQDRWLERVLADDYEHDKKHSGRIELPY